MKTDRVIIKPKIKLKERWKLAEEFEKWRKEHDAMDCAFNVITWLMVKDRLK
jgi:hypothetical protein